MQNPEWSEREQALVNEVETGGVHVNMSGRRLDEHAVKPIAWALLNEVQNVDTCHFCFHMNTIINRHDAMF